MDTQKLSIRVDLEGEALEDYKHIKESTGITYGTEIVKYALRQAAKALEVQPA